jgi:hypothetical protein
MTWLLTIPNNKPPTENTNLKPYALLLKEEQRGLITCRHLLPSRIPGEIFFRTTSVEDRF